MTSCVNTRLNSAHSTLPSEPKKSLESLGGSPWEAQRASGCQLDFLYRECLPTSSPLCKQSPGLLPTRGSEQAGGGWELGLTARLPPFNTSLTTPTLQAGLCEALNNLHCQVPEKK